MIICKPGVRCWVFLVLFLLTGTAYASGLDLVCRCSYNISDGQVNLTAEYVENNRSSGTSGTLKLKLWATTTPYSGGSISGYIMGQYQFSSVLESGYRFVNIDRTVDFKRPPDGIYYVTMTLTEYDGADYIQDYVAFSNTITIGEPVSGDNTLAFLLDTGDYTTETLSAGYTHVYQFSVNTTGTLVMNSSGDLDLTASLYDADSGDLIVEDDNSGSDDNFLVSATISAGNYELHIQGKYSSTQGDYYLYSEFTPDTSSTSDISELSLIMTSDGSSTTANFSLRVAARGNGLLDEDFTSGDDLLVVGTAYPQAADLGQSAEIYVVMRIDIGTSKRAYFRNQDGQLVSWTGKLPELEPAYVIDSLDNVETFVISDSRLQEAGYRVFLGYRLPDSNGPIHFNGQGYKLDVKNLDTYASLGGKVINGDTGRPLTWAEVEVFNFVSGYESATVYTNSSGDYFIRVFKDRLAVGNTTFYARAAAEGCLQSPDYFQLINNDNHAVIDFVLTCDTNGGSDDGNNDGTADSASISVTNASCTAQGTFSWGLTYEWSVNISGTASGPVGTSVTGPGDPLQCGSWSNCERQAGEPESTSWTSHLIEGVSPFLNQYFRASGPLTQDSVTASYSCPSS